MKCNFSKRLSVVAFLLMSVILQAYSAGSKFSEEQLRRIFPAADNVQTADSSEYVVFDHTQTKIGRVIVSSPFADNIVGFFSQVPLLIGFDSNENIAGVLLLENRETAEYVIRVENSGLLEQWNGLSGKEALEKQVDVVSGATLTSGAVIQTFQKRVSEDVRTNSNTGSGFLWIILLGGVALLLGGFYYFFKR